MSSITIRNPAVSDNIKSFVNQDYESGSSLVVESTSSFSVGQYIVVGEIGNEKTSVTNITAIPSSTTLTITALSHSFPKGTPVAYVRYDKYSLEYRPTSVDSFSVYGGMPANLRFDAINTEYKDSAATQDYAWKYRYYSSETSTYSGYSDILSAAGWGDSSVGYMIRQIRKIINDPESKTITDTELIRFLNAAQDKIYTLFDRWWFLKKTGTTIDSVASQRTYNLPSDFGRMSRVKFRYINGAEDTTYLLKYITETEYDYVSRDNTADDDDAVKYFTIYPGDATNPAGYLKIFPSTVTAGLDIIPIYYKTFTDLDSYGDTTECPIPSMLEDYALAQVFKIRKEEDKANFYDKSFREQVELLKLMQRKQVGQPRQLWNYQGPDAVNKLFGNKSLNRDSRVENYW